MQSSVHIRKAHEAEISILLKLIRSMAMESEGRNLNTDVLTKGIHAVFNNPALGTYWVIAEGDDIVGSTLITTEWSDWHNAPYWWIQSLFIRPEARGRGLFEQLLSVLEAEARSVGVCEIRLYVESDNARAIRAYEKTGFHSGQYRFMKKSL